MNRIKTTMLIGAGTAAALPAAAIAQDIVYTPLGAIDGDISIGANQGTTLVRNIDLDQDGSPDFRFRREINSTTKLYIDGDSGNAQGNNDEDEIVALPASPDGLNPAPLVAGDLIDGSANFRFASNDNGGAGESLLWSQDGEGAFPVDGNEYFIGVRTVIDGQTVFGWIGVVLVQESGSTLSAFMTGHAYDTTGAPITAGDTGESTGDPCPPDQDLSGVLDIDDFSVFVQNFFAGNTVADVNTDGMLDIDDFSDFVAFFFNSSQFPGCP